MRLFDPLKSDLISRHLWSMTCGNNATRRMIGSQRETLTQPHLDLCLNVTSKQCSFVETYVLLESSFPLLKRTYDWKVPFLCWNVRGI